MPPAVFHQSNHLLTEESMVSAEVNLNEDEIETEKNRGGAASRNKQLNDKGKAAAP
jgi:hypothetical protein